MPKAVITDSAEKEPKEVPQPEPEPQEEQQEAPDVEVAEDGQELIEDDDVELAEGIPLESLDPEEELWEGGPTVGQALEWKQQYGRLYITSLDFDEHILWRPILRSEYKEHVRTLERLTNSGKVSQLDANLMNEEMMAQTCMLWPTYDPTQESLAGVPSMISQEIMEASGFVALQVRQL